MVLHSTEQLVTQDVAMSMPTTSHQMAFYKMVKMRGSSHLKTTMCRRHTYERGHVQDLKVDLYKDEPHIQKPLKCYSRCPANGESLIVESDPQILESWKDLHAEPKLFMHAAMHAIDILSEHFSSLDLKDVKRNHNKAFIKGWKEPEYRMMTVCDLQTEGDTESGQVYPLQSYYGI